jgi:AcrR family transcriptional regulator
MSQTAAGHPAVAHAAEGAGAEVSAEAPHRGDTRARIQAVAIELFSEQGYDKTSLREIAERLDVTKAALYYHFKSKEDIILSLVDDYFGQVDELVRWGKRQRRTPARRVQILSRYLDMVIGSQHIYRMLHQNQAALASISNRKYHGEMFKERTRAIIDLLTDPGAGLDEQVRAATAATSVSICWMLFRDEVTDTEALRKSVLGLASELVDWPEAAATTDTAPGRR